MSRTKTTPIFAVALTLALGALAAPAWAAQPGGRASRGHWGEAQALRLQFGLFEPRGESIYWSEKALDFTGDPSSFEDLVVGVDYLRFLNNRLGLALSGNFYSNETGQRYRDFVDNFGGEIRHTTTLELAALNAGLIFHLAPRDAVISPYVGAGAGLTLWSIAETGDFIDFSGGGDIFFGDFETDGAAFGHYFQAGVEVPMAPNWSAYADVKWLRSNDELDGDFEGFGELDLSGRAIAFGVSWSF